MRSLKLIFALVIALLSGRLAQECQAQNTTSVTVSWNLSSSTNVAGYYLAWGTNSGVYFATNVYDGAVTNGMITGLDYGVLYYIAVAAFTSNGVVSPFSNETTFSNAPPPPVVVTTPPPPTPGKSGKGPSTPTPTSTTTTSSTSSGGSTGTGSGSSTGGGSGSNNIVQAQIWGIPPVLGMTVTNQQPMLAIGGTVGATVTIQCNSSLGSPYTWTTVTNITLSNAAPIQSSNAPGQPQDAIDLAYVPALQSTPLPSPGPGQAQFYRVTMPYDYVILASITLPPQGYTARLIVVNMPGLNDDGCYVGQAGSFIHYTGTNSSLQLETSGSTIREIATTLAESLNLDWTTASEFVYTNGVGQILATVVEADSPSSDPVAGQTPPTGTIAINF